MQDPCQRLIAARLAAGYSSAASAARAMGIGVATYNHHENGTRGFVHDGERYARFFRVSLEWLLTGRGEMKTRRERIIPVHGLVGAGASVEMIGDSAAIDPPDEVELPSDGSLAALQVRGESQWPRFLDGEYILFDRMPVDPASQTGRYAIVQTIDGRRLIKTLRRSREGGDNRWRLESHNAPPEDPVELMGCWRYLGTLPGKA
jgi:phage repressor protein C with HTH and peptisase S24 domain